MNYHAKFNIAECSFNKITNPAFLGVFADDSPVPINSPAIDTKYTIRRSITITSYAGGGAGFACVSTVTPVPAMPPGAAVGAKVPPAASVARSSSESTRAGGALYLSLTCVGYQKGKALYSQ